MRIICPRCSAEYEVPDSFMPPGARDVQCSECGHSWYQLVSRQASPQAKATAPGPSEDENRLQRLREALDGHKARVSTRSTGRTLNLGQVPGESDALDAATQDGAQSSPPPEEEDKTQEDTAPAPQRGLDPAVAAVLRSEAEFERNARAHGAAQALEMQPDLGLEPPARGRGPETVRDRLARLQAAERTGSAALTRGEETYPDPAGLGQTLQRTERPPPPPPAPVIFSKAGLPVRAERRDLAIYEAQRRARQGFRWGFFLSLGICLAAPALYLAAPALAGLMPAQSPIFEGIARTGAELHVALASAVQDWLLRIGGWMNGLSTPTA